MKQILVELRDDTPISQQMAEACQAFQAGGYQKMVLHIYSGIPDEEKLVRVARQLRQCCDTELIMGTMSAGEIKDGRLLPQGILVSAMLFECTDVQLLRYDDAKGREALLGAQIRQDLDAIDNLKGVELLFPGTEMDTMQMFAEISLCRPGIQIFGGYTGGHKLNSPEHFIFDHTGVMYNSILVMTLAGKDFHIDVDKSIGWDALGKDFKVTRAEGKHLIELDGKPAAQVYEKFLQIDRKMHNNAEEAFEFPLIARKDGEQRLRSTVHIEEDGSLYLHGFVTEGMDISLSYGNPTNIVETVNQRLEVMRRFKPQAILLYSCVVRKTFWEDFVDMEMEPFARIASTCGFHTWGEVLRNDQNGDLGENNITMLSIGMREGEAPAEDLPEIRVDDTVLQGQASLLKRMSRLVSTTMDELQKAHNDLSVLNQKLTVMAEHDALTGIYNRGKIERLIDDAVDLAAREGRAVSLIMVDLDHFKRVNDTYGHDIGDAVLRDIGRILRDRAACWPGAQTGRWGGEEFFLLLPDADEAQAIAFADQLGAAVRAHTFAEVKRLTISQGVITVHGCRDYRRIYIQVDDALYRAKQAGRNRVVQAESLRGN